MIRSGSVKKSGKGRDRRDARGCEERGEDAEEEHVRVLVDNEIKNWMPSTRIFQSSDCREIR